MHPALFLWRRAEPSRNMKRGKPDMTVKHMRLFVALAVIAAAAALADVSSSSAAGTVRECAIGEFETHPLVLYYAPAGATEMISLELARMLVCESEAITSGRKKNLIGKLNGAIDQFFSRDDAGGPIKHAIKEYDPLIIIAPIWMHKLSSPVRTFIQRADLKDKALYVVVTHGGSYSAGDEEKLKEWLSSYSSKLKDIYTISTRDKPPEQLKEEAAALVKNIGW